MNPDIPPESATAHAYKLGLFLVAEHLGVVCRHICSVLLSRGRMTFDEIIEAMGNGGLSDVHHRPDMRQQAAVANAKIARNSDKSCSSMASHYFISQKKTPQLHARSTLYNQAASGIDGGLNIKFNKAEISKALIVLNHHGLLTALRIIPDGQGHARKKYVTYDLNLRNMLLRLRFPQFILLTEKFLFGKNSPSFFAAADSERLSEIHEDGEPTMKEGTGLGSLDETLPLHARALMKSILTCSQVTENILYREATREFRVELEEMAIDIAEESERFQEEKEKMRQVFLLLRENNIIIPSSGVAIVEEDSTKSHKSRKRGRIGMAEMGKSESALLAASKRRRTNKGSAVGVEENDEMWFTVNFCLLHRMIRDNHLRDFVASKFDDSSDGDQGVGYVFGCILRAAREKHIGKQSCKFVKQVSFKEVAEASRAVCKYMNGGPRILSEGEVLKAALELEKCKCLGIVQVTKGSTALNLYPSKLVAYIQRKIAEEFVFERYGEKSTRIFRLLLDKGQLDQKLVSELALIPIKHVRAMLYRMMKDGIIKLQEIAKRADRTPQNTYFMWSVDLPSAYYAIVEFVHRSIFNLALRKQRGTNENEDVVKRCEIAGGGFTRLIDMDPSLIKVGMQSCRDTAEVGKVTAVDAQNETFTVMWPHGEKEIISFDDPNIGVADETQLTEEDQTRYHALLLATDRIDHTVQRLDEVLTILMEFHTHYPNRLTQLSNERAYADGDAECISDELE